MESIDYWQDSQYDSVVDFDDCIYMVVPDSLAKGEEAAAAVLDNSGDVMDTIMEESADDQLPIVEDSGEVVCSFVDEFGKVLGSTVEDSSEVMESIVQDTYCDEDEMASCAIVEGFDKKLEPIVDFRRVKSRVTDSRPKFIHDFDLNEPSDEEKELAAKRKCERDFDLNKLSIEGMFRLTDPSREPDFIEMLRLLLPSFY